MDAARWSQDEMASSSAPIPIHNSSTTAAGATANTTPVRPTQLAERRGRPHQRGDQPLNCPRCNSSNTKFCYYNNYSLTQPRYFCKSCRRYWTEGGSLRNVPVGGGSRKNKKPSSSNSSNTAPASSNNNIPSALNLGFNTFPRLESNTSGNTSSTMATNSSAGNPASVFGSFAPMPLPEYTAGYGVLHDLRPAILGFPLDGSGNVGAGVGASGVAGVYGGMQQQVQETTGRLLFPFEDLKPVVPGANAGDTSHFDHNSGQTGDTNQPPAGFWSGMMSGGGGGGGAGTGGSW